MQIVVSAPGKIHLLGEHAVVYGRPALLAAIDKRIYVTIETQSSKVKAQNYNKLIINTSEEDYLVKKAVLVFKKAFSIKKFPPLEISITSQIPVGSGLGSSAAVASSTIGALMELIKNIWNPEKTNKLAYEVEKYAHGNPSGADNTTVVFGGLVWYRKELDFLKLIWSLPIASYKLPHFILVDSGRPEETTKEMVSNVLALYKKNIKKMENIFHNQEAQTKRLLLSFASGNLKEMIASLKTGERNLEKMGIVGRFAKKIIKEIERKGGVAKVCGAGGTKIASGMLLCYHKNLNKIKEIGKKHQLPVYSVILGGEGIRIEK